MSVGRLAFAAIKCLCHIYGERSFRFQQKSPKIFRESLEGNYYCCKDIKVQLLSRIPLFALQIWTLSLTGGSSYMHRFQLDLQFVLLFASEEASFLFSAFLFVFLIIQLFILIIIINLNCVYMFCLCLSHELTHKLTESVGQHRQASHDQPRF